MAGLENYNAARQEAFEEAGVVGRMTRKRIGSYVYDKQHPSREVKTLHVDVFALAVVKTLRIWPERTERKRQWLSAEEAARAVNEPELKRLIKRFCKKQAA